MKTTTWVPLAALAVIALGAVTAGCGGDDQSSSSAGDATDAAFITDMTAHHEGAVEMARIAQKRAEHSEIRGFAADIVAAQESEISVMKTIRRDVDHMGEHSGGHMGMSDLEMGMGMNMAALETATPFDRAFIDAMIPHHQGAVGMAEQLLKRGEQPGLRKMSTDMIAAQTKEIAQMRAWRKAWYGSSGRLGRLDARIRRRLGHGRLMAVLPRTAGLAFGGGVLAAALWWRKHPSACPYGQRFWVEPPHPLITRRRLRDVLEVGPGDPQWVSPKRLRGRAEAAGLTFTRRSGTALGYFAVFSSAHRVGGTR
jgi:uncharacterized protein (DUF305 family)